jgi:hypothetical protein
MSGTNQTSGQSLMSKRAWAVARREEIQPQTINWLVAILVIAGLFILALRPVQAAPQILGLVASAEPLPMKCENGLCATEASVFCLQKWRMSPVAGTSYHPAGGEGVQLVALTEDGMTIVVPEPELQIKALRGHSAVQIGVDVEWLYARKYQSVSLKIGNKVSLIPEAWAGDPKPLTKKDIETALGTLRDLGHKLVDTAGTNVAAAQLLAHVGGKLPRLGRAHDDIRNAAWQTGLKDVSDINAKVLAKAKKKFERCHDVTFGGSTSLRQCLGAQHDIFMGKLNARYWSASEYGM